MKQFPLLVLLLLFVAAAWADDLEPSVQLHAWGAELDVAWRPVVLVPHTQTTFWLGGGGLYKSWNYFRDASGNALTAADVNAAAVNEMAGSWFVGAAQGIVGQPTPFADGHKPWQTPNLLEAYTYYRGTVISTLSSGSYLANSNRVDRNGYVQTAFLAGLDLNTLTKTDDHNLLSGFLLEGAAETAPVGFQSVDVDYNRLTATLTLFLPVYDANPDSRLNTLSVLFGANMILDHLSGSNIPSEAQGEVGGRAWAGVLGFADALGGAVRGIESNRFDGTDKAVGNLDLRINLPGLDYPEFVKSLSPFPLEGSLIPGIVLFYDYGAWGGLNGIDPNYVTTAGAGVFLRVGHYGSVQVYFSQWLTGGTPYNTSALPISAALGMQF
jgi:hypothetical protein